MTIKKIDKDVFARFVNDIRREQKVIGVCAQGDRFDFAQLDSAEQLRLDYDVTLQPPKSFSCRPPKRF
jgi:hypothetical protein